MQNPAISLHSTLERCSPTKFNIFASNAVGKMYDKSGQTYNGPRVVRNDSPARWLTTIASHEITPLKWTWKSRVRDAPVHETPRETLWSVGSRGNYVKSAEIYRWLVGHGQGVRGARRATPWANVISLNFPPFHSLTSLNAKENVIRSVE